MKQLGKRVVGGGGNSNNLFLHNYGLRHSVLEEIIYHFSTNVFIFAIKIGTSNPLLSEDGEMKGLIFYDASPPIPDLLYPPFPYSPAMAAVGVCT